MPQSSHAVSALGWSPDGRTLAVGTAEGTIDLYDAASWRRLARCRGHSAVVAQLDWARDSAVLQSNCNACTPRRRRPPLSPSWSASPLPRTP